MYDYYGLVLFSRIRSLITWNIILGGGVRQLPLDGVSTTRSTSKWALFRNAMTLVEIDDAETLL